MATLSAKEAAREIGCDARTFRKFMRSITAKEDQPGQGNRYSIEQRQMSRLKRQFAEWNTPKPKAEKPKKEAAIEEVVFVGDDDLDELGDPLTDVDEPTAEDLYEEDPDDGLEELGADDIESL
jgi:hypothetical protein